MKGLYNKYIITKTSGKPLDPNFYAMVLRIDGGQYVDACRMGVKAFADAVRPLNPDLALDIDLKLLEYTQHLNEQQGKLGELEERNEY
jgi:hypothetical protein